jgi:inner membrane protein
MQKALLLKAVLIGMLFLILLIPLKMIDGLVSERAARQRAVVQEIATSNYGRQIFAGLILSIPYVEEYDDTVTEAKTEKVQTRRIKRVARFFPANSDVAGEASVGTKYRGLFKARVFNWQATARGEFNFDGKLAVERARENSRISWGKPTVSLGLSDPRGLIGSPILQWAGRQIAFERGSGLPNMASGLHAEVPGFDPAKPQRLEYSLTVGLLGTESLAIVPVADNNQVRLNSDWPHPSFGGQFLPRPESQRRARDGFEAQWTVTALATNAQQQLLAAFDGKKECREDFFCADRLDVRFIEPIDIYSLSDRALKYGFLFVAFTFGAFFMFEAIKTWPIHPAQYFLVGLALATFFLLLIGLSEHIAFWTAYLAAAVACIALLGFYLSAALRGIGRGLSFSVMLTALYGALYGLLVSEDNALLLGALLVFGLVAAAMLMTRKVDWYGLGTLKG